MTACDRCPMVQSHAWWRPSDGLELRFCDLHEDKHWIALTANGFEEKYPPLDDRADEAPIVTSIGGGPLDADCG